MSADEEEEEMSECDQDWSLDNEDLGKESDDDPPHGRIQNESC